MRNCSRIALLLSESRERVKRNDEKLPTLETAKARNCNQLNIIALSLSLTLLTHSFASSRPPLSASLSSHVIFHHILLRVTQKITNHHLFFVVSPYTLNLLVSQLFFSGCSSFILSSSSSSLYTLFFTAVALILSSPHPTAAAAAALPCSTTTKMCVH